jgi:hypothetical protein
MIIKQETAKQEDSHPQHEKLQIALYGHAAFRSPNIEKIE